MKEKILLIVINVLLFVNCCIRAEDVVPYAEQAYVEMWTNLNGSSVQNLTTTENYLRSPNKSFFVDKLDIRPNGSKYGIRVRGCITPKETKEYTFWLSTDNGGELWLSSDDSSENLKKIAYQLYCSSIGQWDKYPTQKSETVVLEAGKSYYFEAFQKEHSGGDHLQVAWSYDGGSPEIIQGDVLGLFNKNDTQPPAKPENIIVYSLSENVNAMTWSKTTDNIAVFEYRIYKNGEYIKSVKTNFYSFASIEDSGVPDKYSVSAVDLLGNESDVSVAVSQADNALSSVDADNVNGLLGYYYNSLDCFMPSLVRLDANIDFYWSSGSPGQGINKDFFSVLWEGEVEPRYSEEYTFYAFADDGVRVWVNNELIIERWGYAPDELVSKSIILEAGKKYDIRIQHCERVGGACCKLSWASKSQTKEVLPSSCLYPKSLKNGSDVANTWTGFGDNNLYSNPLNWSKGVVPGENAIICFLPEYNNSCHIDSDISVKSMVVCSGYDASITSDNHTVNLTGDLVVDTGEVSLSEQAKFCLIGGEKQNISLNYNVKPHHLIVDKPDGGSAKFLYSFNTSIFTVTPGSRVQIGPWQSVYADKIDWQGTKEKPINIGLSKPGPYWYLRLKRGGGQLVSYVNVSSSNAYACDPIDGTSGCTDLGNNKNWIFSFASVVEINDSAVEGAIQVEGVTQGGEIEDITIMVNGVEVPVAVDRGDVWYSDARLVEGQENKIEVLKDGEVVYTKVVAYTPSDIKGRDIIVRHRDGKLLKTSDGLSSSTSIVVDMNNDGVYESNVFSSNVFALSFDKPGEYYLPAKIDLNRDGDFDDTDEDSQTIKINSIEVDFNGPVACMLGYQRDKNDITVKGIDPSQIVITASNPAACIISRVGANETGPLIKIHPITSDNHVLFARLGGSDGPIIEHIPLDAFMFKTTARNQMEIIKQFSNTDVLVRGKMMMFPYVKDLDISMHIFVWGTTFEDSTIDKEFYTNDFSSIEDETMPFGTYGMEYKMIMTKERLFNHGPCHKIKIYQNDVVIGE